MLPAPNAVGIGVYKKNTYMSPVERMAFFNFVYKKYQDKDPKDFDIYFSDKKIAPMCGEIGSWKVNLF